jgi:hypothetical protein
MNQQFKEQRKYDRFPFREDILIDGTKMCTSMDICEGGLYVSAIQVFERNSIVDLAIPFKGAKVTLKAQVQYCQPGIGMGIRFIDMSDNQKAAVRELIEGLRSSV